MYTIDKTNSTNIRYGKSDTIGPLNLLRNNYHTMKISLIFGHAYM